MATRKEDVEYVQITDLAGIKDELSQISGNLSFSIDSAGQHLDLISEKHSGVAKAKIQIAEVVRHAEKLSGFFVKEFAKHEHEFNIPRREVFAKEDKEIEVQGRQALKNIQHNLEDLKKHLNLL
ncbi:MAG TPA: hypothetical protein HA224_04590 [Nanoarchaeota archaeon]|nr:hypothetical protein [Nanoarchaeota archaeon]